MARYDYQYGTSPRKLEPEYEYHKKKKQNKKNVKKKQYSSKSKAKSKNKTKSKKQKKISFEVKFFLNSMLIFAMVFAMIACQALVEQRYKEKESLKQEYDELVATSATADDTSEDARKLATEYGMETKSATLIDLGTTDYIETSVDEIQTQKSLWDKIVEFFTGLF